MYGQENAQRDYGVPEIRSAEVPREVSRLTELSEYLEKCLAALEDKLTPVLAQRKPEGPVDAKSAPEPLRVPLAEMLHIRCNHLEMIRARIDSITSRLEV